MSTASDGMRKLPLRSHTSRPSTQTSSQPFVLPHDEASAHRTWASENASRKDLARTAAASVVAAAERDNSIGSEGFARAQILGVPASAAAASTGEASLVAITQKSASATVLSTPAISRRLKRNKPLKRPQRRTLTLSEASSNVRLRSPR